MRPSSPHQVTVTDFGRDYGATTKVGTVPILSGGEPCYGIAIAPDSEIDACYIIGQGGEVPQGAGVEGGQNAISGGQARDAIPPGSLYRLSCEAPLVGRFKGPLQISPYYSYGGGNQFETLDPAGASLAFTGRAKLSILIYTDPITAPLPVKRGVLRAGWRNKGTTPFLCMATMGRKLLRVWARAHAGAATVLWAGYGFCNPADGQEWSFTASPLVVPANNAGPSGLPAGMAFITSGIPDFFFLRGQDPATSVLVEAYD